MSRGGPIERGLWPAPSRRLVLGAGLGGLLAPSAAAAPAFPVRPLMIIVPANPGGGVDQLARLMQNTISVDALSPRPIEVINRPGAGGAVGLAELVTRYHGDAHAIMPLGGAGVSAQIAQGSPLSILDTEPLARLMIEPLVVATPANSPYRSIGDLLAAFRREPRSFTWCGGIAAGADHLLIALIAEACGVAVSDLRYVAYQGGGPAMAALVGGQVTAGVNTFSELRGLAASGRVRLLAAASPERFGDRSIPTLREAGLDVVLDEWRGLFAAPDVAPERLEWWTSLIERMHASETWRAHLTRIGGVDGYLPREQFAALVRADHARFTRILARLGIAGTSGGYSVIGPYAVPALVGTGGAAAIVATVVEHRRAPAAAAIAAGAEDDDADGGPLPDWRRLLLGGGLLLAYIAALAIAGFLIATPIFVLSLCVLMRSKRLILDAVVGVLLTAAVWLLFTRLLSVGLP